MQITGPIPIDAKALDQGRWRISPSFRTRVILALVAFGLVTWSVVAGGLILNARNAVQEEVQSSFSVVARYVQARKMEIEDLGLMVGAAEDLRLDSENARHVRALVLSDGGPPHVQDIRPPEEEDEDAPPRWFLALLETPPFQKTIDISPPNGVPFSVIIESMAYDEISEVWQDFRLIVPVTIGHTVLLLGVAIAAINRIFSRITLISHGIGQLEAGNLSHRLAMTDIPELASVTDQVNKLADRLRAKEAENREISRHLLTVQDNERRQVAHDLHDELGPYLFGLGAAARQLAAQGAGVETAAGGPDLKTIHEATETITEITQTVQARVRKLLTALRPMSVGEVPLAELLNDVTLKMNRLAKDAEIQLDARTGPATYGETVDLTVYRFTQESIVNALKHGGATQVRIELEEITLDHKQRIRVKVSDNGSGVHMDGPGDGYGLTGIAERVRVLGGTWHPPTPAADRTITSILIPIEADVKTPNRGPKVSP
ncbi:histidine kinase [Rhodospirillum sp. A1_3_36]|uniref:histidine kinase n=1 Tax=Rhodospirillum sp. A1_3_36 TaxID=3391666 RepID=UPI0039A524D5